MSTLHTVNAAAVLPLCLRTVAAEDGLLFIEDGVYLALQARLADPLAGVHLYALAEDVAARGLDRRLDARVEPVSMVQFVELCCTYDKVINWF